MYRRFLTNNDYLSLLTPEALEQLTRGNHERFLQAEEAAEMSIVEYLSENYEIEHELQIGKYIAAYNRRISFPLGVHIHFEDRIYEVIRPIQGILQPALTTYWQQAADTIRPDHLPPYSQFSTYYPGHVVLYRDTPYICLAENGFKFNDIRIPLLTGWAEITVAEWEPQPYALWDVVKFDNAFYTLLTHENFSDQIDPFRSDNWGAIADYDPDYNDYEISTHEYVVFHGRVFYPETQVNAQLPQIGVNLSLHDPRNYNLVKHMLRLAVYELTKLVAPNNIGIVRLRDYDNSMKWLNDAARLRINPMIPRRLAPDQKPVLDWQVATFQADYDPYKNPWMV